MASVSEGVIPRSKIKSYAEDDLGLSGDEVDFFIEVIRRVERKSSKAAPADPETKPGAAEGVSEVKAIVNRLAPQKGRPVHRKAPRVRHPR